MTGPLARFRKPEVQPPPAKKVKQPLVARKAKGIPPPSVMSRPRPVGDPHAELLWRAERLVRKLAKIPADQVHVPQPKDTAVPDKRLAKLATGLAEACGLSTSPGLRRNKLAFWSCLEMTGWIFNTFVKDDRIDARARFAIQVRSGMSDLEKQTIIAP